MFMKATAKHMVLDRLVSTKGLGKVRRKTEGKYILHALKPNKHSLVAELRTKIPILDLDNTIHAPGKDARYRQERKKRELADMLGQRSNVASTVRDEVVDEEEQEDG